MVGNQEIFKWVNGFTIQKQQLLVTVTLVKLCNLLKLQFSHQENEHITVTVSWNCFE